MMKRFSLKLFLWRTSDGGVDHYLWEEKNRTIFYLFSSLLKNVALEKPSISEDAALKALQFIKQQLFITASLFSESAKL